MASQAQIESRYLCGRPPTATDSPTRAHTPTRPRPPTANASTASYPTPQQPPSSSASSPNTSAARALYTIAESLTCDGILCPSAHDRARPHRDGHAWSKSAVRAILRNSRYTGHEVWNKRHKDEASSTSTTSPSATAPNSPGTPLTSGSGQPSPSTNR
ncbi:recombinase family protein [Streptomyces sp. NPDC001633]|uniref:recombinase family protein n=1 Tax=Streptomyces sp. NPDC001633 TaxID=3364595 RepID=UPI0036BA91A6